jgi:hypothetical protein
MFCFYIYIIEKQYKNKLKMYAYVTKARTKCGSIRANEVARPRSTFLYIYNIYSSVYKKKRMKILREQPSCIRNVFNMQRMIRINKTDHNRKRTISRSFSCQYITWLHFFLYINHQKQEINKTMTYFQYIFFKLILCITITWYHFIFISCYLNFLTSYTFLYWGYIYVLNRTLNISLIL